MNTYTQITYEQRCQIYALKDTGCRQQSKAGERRLKAVKAFKMTSALIALIESRIRELLSPEQISGWLLTERQDLISHETIYRHIWADQRHGGDWYQYLRRQGKKYQSRGKGQAGRGHIKNRVSIDEPPAIVDERARMGNWEIDLVIGKGHHCRKRNKFYCL